MRVLLVVIDAASPRVVCPGDPDRTAAQPEEAGRRRRNAPGVDHHLPVDHAGRHHVDHHRLLPRRTRHRRRVVVRRRARRNRLLRRRLLGDCAGGFRRVPARLPRPPQRRPADGPDALRDDRANRPARGLPQLSRLSRRGPARGQSAVAAGAAPRRPLTETVDGPDAALSRRLRHLMLAGAPQARTARAASCTASAWTTRRRRRCSQSWPANARHCRTSRSPISPTTTTAATRSGRTRRCRSSSASTPRSAPCSMPAGGFDRFLRDTCVIVTSDHGHCDILADRGGRRRSPCTSLFERLPQAALGRPWQDGDEIMICPNMRAAQIYVHATRRASTERSPSRLLLEPRIDLVMWRSAVTRRPMRPATSCSGPRGRLEFWRDGDDRIAGASGKRPGTMPSGRGGAGAAMRGARPAGRRRRRAVADYPNAFERIAGVLDAPQQRRVLGDRAAGLRVRGARRARPRRRRLARRTARARLAQPGHRCRGAAAPAAGACGRSTSRRSAWTRLGRRCATASATPRHGPSQRSPRQLLHLVHDRVHLPASSGRAARRSSCRRRRSSAGRSDSCEPPDAEERQVARWSPPDRPPAPSPTAPRPR